MANLTSIEIIEILTEHVLETYFGDDMFEDEFRQKCLIFVDELVASSFSLDFSSEQRPIFSSEWPLIKQELALVKDTFRT